MTGPLYEADLYSAEGIRAAAKVAAHLGIDPNTISRMGHFRVVRHGTMYYAEYLTPDTFGPRMPRGARLTRGANWIYCNLLDCRIPVDPERLKEVLE